MIEVSRTYPAPSVLEIEKSKPKGKYNVKEVVEQLGKDFCNKCYLCESKGETLNIEHLKSHRENKDLKFDWDNLFLSCGHCNNIKLALFDNILDCTKEKIRDKISFKMDPYPKAKVEVKGLSDEDKVNKTVELLEKIYNGTSPLKQLDSNNLRKRLLKNLMDFQMLLIDYFDSIESKDEDESEFYRRRIKLQLGKNSEFAAFKRCVISDIPDLYDEFKEYIE